MGFYGRRWGSRGGNTSKAAKKKMALKEPSDAGSTRVTRSNSGLNQPDTSTRVTRSNSGLKQPDTSTRVTRSGSVLQRIKQREDNCSPSVSEDDFSVISDDDHFPSEPPVDTIDSEIYSNVRPRSSAIIEDDNSLKFPINTDNQVPLKVPPTINDDDDVSVVVPPERSSISNDEHSTAHSTEHNNNDSDTCFKSPFSMQRSSSLRMDEDFDIDTFLGETNEESTTTMGDIGTEISDEDFLNQFPKVNFSMINEVKKPKATPKRKLENNNPKGKQSSIAEYALNTSGPQLESNIASTSTSKGNAGSFPLKHRLINVDKKRSIAGYAVVTTSPPVHSNIVTPSTSKGFKGLNSTPVKRCLDDILPFHNDIENQNPKKPKLETSSNSAKDFPVESRSPLQNKDINTESDDTDEELPDDLKDYDFPNLAEDINFDVSAIRSNLHTTFRGNVGEKRYQTYLKERFLTNDCVEKLYESIKSIPADTIERDPRGLTVQLMPHQRHALKWMRWRENQQPKGGILADDMGLGKTIQTISLILAAKNDKRDKVRANGEAVIDTDDDLDEDWGEAENDESREIIDGRTLVVCPASVLRQWEREVHTKCRRGILRVFIYHGLSKKISTRELAKYDIVLTTYHLIQQERDLHIAPTSKKNSKIFKIKWERVILDEAHYIRNFQGKISVSTCELSTKIKWALTGTPIQNRKSDFYALLKFLKCHPFDQITVWRRWVGPNTEDANKRLKVITSTLMLRRTKAELIAKGAIQSLPEKNFDLIEVDLDPEEKIVYQKLLLYSRTFFNEFLQQREDRQHIKRFGTHRRRNIVQQEVPDKITRLLVILMKHHVEIDNYYILVLILRLRQMCCHPFLVKSMVDREDVDLGSTENVIENKKFNEEMMAELNKLTSDDEEEDEYEINDEMARRVMSKANHVFDNNRKGSKVRAVLDVIYSILEKGEKLIVVSQWTSFLQVIANNLYYMEGANYEMFTGKVAVKNRQAIVDRLNDSDDSLNVLLLSLTAGGVGLNLVGANNLLLLDLHWNPQLETQAMDRIYRFGQENSVHIYKFVCRDTIEEKVKKLQDMKLAIANNVLSGSISNRLTIEDLKLLFS